MQKNSFVFVVLFFSILSISVYSATLNYLGMLRGFTNGDRFGTVAVNAGDINGDGFNDLLVSAPGSYQSPDNPGMVYVYLGGKDPKEPALILKGEAPGDRFGIAITMLGDINGDKIGDFAISADKNDEGGLDAGKVYIYFGGKQLDSTPEIVLTGERSNDWFGASLAGGMDINGDGIPDLLVGASYAGKNYAGAVYVFLGGSRITSPAVKIEGEVSGDGFGQRVEMLGDLDGDNFNDFGVSSFYHNSEGQRNSGKVYLYRGGSVISKDAWRTIGGKRAQANFGFVLTSAGDLNKDGRPDILIGAPSDGPNGQGAVYIYYGGPVIRDPAVVIYGEHPKDLYGFSLTMAGDLNGDGFGDILVGAPFADIGNYRSGRVEIFFGSANMDGIYDFHINGNEPDAQCGSLVAYVPKFFGKSGLYLVSSPGPLGNGKPAVLHLYK